MLDLGGNLFCLGFLVLVSFSWRARFCWIRFLLLFLQKRITDSFSLLMALSNFLGIKRYWCSEHYNNTTTIPATSNISYDINKSEASEIFRTRWILGTLSFSWIPELRSHILPGLNPAQKHIHKTLQSCIWNNLYGHPSLFSEYCSLK